MAFQSNSRDPLFDEATQAALERRARELIGLALIAAGTLLALAFWSYAPSDPSFLGTTTEPTRNWLGTPGAYVAAPMFVILGQGAWALAVAACVWGGRFVVHRGAERAFGRTVFLPLWVAICALYAATCPPGADWVHSFGLGGLLGDTALGVLIGIVPLLPGPALVLWAAVLGVTMIAFGLYVLGVSRAELAGARRFLWFGLLFAYDRVARATGDGAARARDRIAARRGARDDDDLHDDDLPFDEDLPDANPAPDSPGGARGSGVTLPAWLRGRETAQDDEADLLDADDDFGDDGPDDGGAPEPAGDRVRAKITDAIRTRLRNDRARAAAVRRAPPPLTAASVESAAHPAPATAGVAETAPDAWDDADLDDWDTDGPEQVPDETPEPVDPAQIPRFEAPRAVVQHAEVRRPKPSTRAQAERQPALGFAADATDGYAPPPLSLLRDPATIERQYLSDEALEENARMLENVLEDYGVKGDIVSVRPGPVVTMYELEPAPGLKASRVIGLADDIARSMAALAARVSTVPGRSVIGIELPNDNREMVLLREIIGSRDFGDSKLKLPIALGKNIGGESIVANLAKMPHLLIAGTTGSGKSVAINTMILSLLYKLTPDECRLIMIDPKMLELSVYDDIPHLLSPVVTDPKKAVVALKWVVAEMEDRYRKMSKMGVRNIEGFNGKVRAALDKGEMFSRTVQTGFDDDTGEPVFETEDFAPETLPYIVVIVDEMADLMMVAGKEIEACIQRLAQMARASGIHLIMATQRPSVDVITGTIKANFPTRISFQVTSKVDSRTILGEQGAEQLLGMGDMLYMAGGGRITRIHAPFVSDEEVEEVVANLKQYGPPDYVGSVAEGPDDEKADDIDLVLGLGGNTGGNTGGEDALYDQAVQIAIRDRKCSTSYIQRKLAIGYNKAARLVEQMEEQGVVSAANHVGKREVLVPEREG